MRRSRCLFEIAIEQIWTGKQMKVVSAAPKSSQNSVQARDEDPDVTWAPYPSSFPVHSEAELEKSFTDVKLAALRLEDSTLSNNRTVTMLEELMLKASKYRA